MKKQAVAPERMKYSPLTLSRSHVLGDFYKRCERLSGGISVRLDNAAGEKLGFVDESLGHYADAFTFHLSEENCKMLAGGKFDYTFDYFFSESDMPPLAMSRRRISLTSIFLTERQSAEKPITNAETDNPDARAVQPPSLY
jgi:hypothetical protein